MNHYLFKILKFRRKKYINEGNLIRIICQVEFTFAIYIMSLCLITNTC